jgi:hypothetical protein
MSIRAGFGAVPLNFTTPVNDAWASSGSAKPAETQPDTDNARTVIVKINR